MRPLILSMGILALLAAGSAGAQTPPPSTQPPAEEEPAGPRITLHGYLSQAYTASDGAQIFGITKEGSSDYRSAAVQVRADITDQDVFVVQFDHERLGNSPLMAFRDDIELDWMFYERRFGDSAIKVGRIQVPFGIYNEVRDVGVALPFFRPSADFYGEGSFNPETIDGAALSHTFRLRDSWYLSGDVYYGNFGFLAFDTEYFKSKGKNTHGIELWLQTPVPGLRIGAGMMRFVFQDTRPSGYPEKAWSIYHLSLAGRFGRFTANTEYSYWDEPPWTWSTFYLQLGYDVTHKLIVNGEIDKSKDALPGQFDVTFNHDLALGANYAFQPNLVLKAEHHWNQGYWAEAPLADVFGPPLKTRYWMLSVATSF